MLLKRSIAAALVLIGFSLSSCGGGESAPPSTRPASPATSAATTPIASGALTCPNGGALVAPEGEALAARVNGQAIALAVFERQAAQAQAALIAQGVDPDSADGKEAIKAIREQTLGTLIDNLLVEQAAAAENEKLSNQQVDARLKSFVSDAGGTDKFNEYLAKNQLTLEDLCVTIRSSALSELMLDRITAKLPTRVEQVRVAHILFDKQEDADKALQQLQAGADFAAVAKQVSKDEATRDNGGELGWIPRDVMPPEFEQAAFALQPGQISGVVQTQLGFHILKVLARDAAHALSPELIQNQKQNAFINWLQQQRDKAKIETLVNL